MKTRAWIIIGLLLGLVAIIALAPAVFAQRPFDGNDPGYGNGPLFDNNLGFGRGMGRGAIAGPMAGGNFGPGSGMGRGQAAGPMMGRGFGTGSPMGPGIAAGLMLGRNEGWGGPENSLVAVTAQVLEMERSELVAELQGSKTLAEVITAHGASVESVVEAFIAQRAEILAERVANGQLTQAQADAMLSMMRARVNQELDEVWSPRGPGQGTGFVDEDGDGVCDNCGAGRGGRMRGRWTQ